MIRVIVVEDSSTARALLISLLRGDPDIEIVGEAADGLTGVALVQKLHPDVVTMDIHMPGMDGLAATKEIMITAPVPIVLVTGTASAADVGLAMSALRAGAVGILQKPVGPGAPGFPEAARHLVTTVKSLAAVKVVRHWRHAPRPGSAPGVPAQAIRDRVVAIAASTGGPAALQTVLAGLPGDYGVPILVVQHITIGFAQGLADWLNNSCDLRVKLAEAGEPVTAHTVYLAPDNRHLGVTKLGKIALADEAPIGGFRPAATHLFDSVARAYGAATTAVILTGMGDDGVAGLRAVRQAGGRVIAEDESTCVVFGMPGAAVAAGVTDLVLPIGEIAPRLLAGRTGGVK